MTPETGHVVNCKSQNIKILPQ